MPDKSESETRQNEPRSAVEVVASSLAAAMFNEAQQKVERELKLLSDSRLIERANGADVFLSEELRRRIINNLMFNEAIPSLRKRTEIE